MTSLPPVQARRAARLKAALTEFDNNIAEMARVVDTPEIVARLRYLDLG